MRITMLSHWPGRGGSSTLLLQMAEFLSGAGHAVRVVVGEDCADPELRDYEVVPPARSPGWRGRIAAYLTAIQATLPEAVYAISGKDEFDVFRFLPCRRIRHISSLERHEYADIPFWIHQLSRFTDAFTANTPDVLAQVLQAAERVTGQASAGWTVPYRVDGAFLALAPAGPVDNQAAGAGVGVCFVGRLDSFQKRAHWFPEIIDRCDAAGRGFHWHVYGQGPQEAALKAELERRGRADAVRFHGWTETATLAAELSRYDVFFLCSRWEGLPIAMVEAMWCGLACVVPAGPGGMGHVLREGGGWLYEARSPARCAEALVAATSDRRVLAQAKTDAQRAARKLFSNEAVEGQLKAFGAGLRNLSAHRRCLEVSRAERFRAVRLHAALRRRLFAWVYHNREKVGP